MGKNITKIQLAQVEYKARRAELVALRLPMDLANIPFNEENGLGRIRWVVEKRIAELDDTIKEIEGRAELERKRLQNEPTELL